MYAGKTDIVADKATKATSCRSNRSTFAFMHREREREVFDRGSYFYLSDNRLLCMCASYVYVTRAN